MAIAWNEQVIQELIAEGNDERLVRLIDALLDLDADQIEARVCLQLHIGERYLILAIARENALVGKNLAEALVRMEKGMLTFPKEVARDALALSWYVCAIDALTTAISQASATYDLGTATRHHALASLLLRADGVQPGHLWHEC